MTQASNLGFQTLTPNEILAAIETTGLACNGDLLALNSYENRVYRLGLEDGQRIVAKFYRPGRWSDAAIIEEHDYTHELAALELPIVAPLVFGGESLQIANEFRFAIYPCKGGRWPSLEDPKTLRQLGRFVARMHLVGEQRAFVHRGSIDIYSHGYDSCDYLIDNDFIPDDIYEAYVSLSEDVLEASEAIFDRCANVRQIRLHGDLHPGNILQEGDALHIVDTDDVRNGPAIQDLWMFLSGEREEQTVQLSHIIKGYEEFRNFDYRELALIEPLRTLRVMHYAAWLARRWDDPAFKHAFVWFESVRYWNEHVLALREQLALLNEPPLAI